MRYLLLLSIMSNLQFFQLFYQIALNSDNAPHCRYFDIDLATNNVECIHPNHNDQNTTDPVLKRHKASECPIQTDMPIIRLGDDYPEGIL